MDYFYRSDHPFCTALVLVRLMGALKPIPAAPMDNLESPDLIEIDAAEHDKHPFAYKANRSTVISSPTHSSFTP